MCSGYFLVTVRLRSRAAKDFIKFVFFVIYCKQTYTKHVVVFYYSGFRRSLKVQTVFLFRRFGRQTGRSLFQAFSAQTVELVEKNRKALEEAICMMASFYHQDQNAVSALFCQTGFPIVSLFPNEKANLTRHSGLGSKATPSCK